MRGLFKGLVWLLAILGIVVGVLRAVALRWWQVPLDDLAFTSSLEPTLHPGDWVILWRLTPPGYGDLAVCPEPRDPTNLVIGRIAGQPLDAITLKGADLYVNGSIVSTETACLPPTFMGHDPTSGSEVEQSCSIEALGGVKHKRGSGTSQSEYNAKVEEDRVFLLSDNRLFPEDSRRYGTVEQKSCKETVVFRLVSAEGFSDVANRLMFIQ